MSVIYVWDVSWFSPDMRTGDLPFLFLLIIPLLPLLFCGSCCQWYFCEVKWKQRTVPQLKRPIPLYATRGCYLLPLTPRRSQSSVKCLHPDRGHWRRYYHPSLPEWLYQSPRTVSCMVKCLSCHLKAHCWQRLFFSISLTFDYWYWPAVWQSPLRKRIVG